MLGETKEIIGRFYANELNDQPIQFVNEMYDTTSEEFQFYADLIEPEVSLCGNVITFLEKSFLPSVSYF